MIKTKFNDIKNQVLDYWSKDAERGLYCGFPFFNEYYSVRMGSCTDITGIPTSGKSQFLLEILINLSEFHQIKHALYVPDIGSNEEVMADLVAMVAKKQFNKTYVSNGQIFDNKNYINESQIYNAGQWIDEYFTLIEYEKKPSPQEIYDDFKKLIKDGIMSGVVDSWKDLRHEMTKRDDLYLDDVLTYRNNLVQKNGNHIFQVIHCKAPDKDKNGQTKAPNAYDMKGGSSWYDNGKSLLSVHRPDPFSCKAEIYILKAKPRVVGKKGVSDKFELNLDTGRYFENDGVQKIYAHLEHKESKLPF